MTHPMQAKFTESSMEDINKLKHQMQLFSVDPDFRDYLPRNKQTNLQ